MKKEIIRFLPTFKTYWGTNEVREGDAMCLFHYFVRQTFKEEMLARKNTKVDLRKTKDVN